MTTKIKNIITKIKLVLLSSILLFSFKVHSGIDNYNSEQQSEKFSISRTTEIKLNTNAVIKNEKNIGNVLLLKGSGYAVINAPNDLSTRQGTISLWIKPVWEKGSNQSHTFITMKWSGNDNSYMAISQGWWEPEGANRLYFILSNQDHIGCSTPYNIRTNAWSMVTVTWLNGSEGHCRIYVDDVRVVSTLTKDKTPSRSPNSNIYIGTDLATTDIRNRKSNFYLGSILIDYVPFTHKKIKENFNNTVAKKPSLDENKLPWTLSSMKKTGVKYQLDAAGRPGEPKVIFDESPNWALTQKSTDEILSKIKKAGFNVYVPCVWHGRGTYYPSNIAHYDDRFIDKINKRIKRGDDPLDYLIKKAHLLGIEVHPWFTITKREDTRYPNFYDEGTPSGAYNVHIPKFRDFIVKLVLDVVSRYSIDGINLDYIRTMGICSSVLCKEDYNERYSSSLEVDRKLAISKSNIPISQKMSAYTRIQAWQDKAIADIVKTISQGARAIRPEIIISVDAHPIAKGNRRLDGRHSIRWANLDWINIIFNMEYSKYVDIENNIDVRQLLNNPNKLILLLGNYEKVDGITIPREPWLMKKYIDFIRTNWPNTGIAFYLQSMLSDEQINILSQKLISKEEDINWFYQQ
jgi:hypothetical protein